MISPFHIEDRSYIVNPYSQTTFIDKVLKFNISHFYILPSFIFQGVHTVSTESVTAVDLENLFEEVIITISALKTFHLREHSIGRTYEKK